MFPKNPAQRSSRLHEVLQLLVNATDVDLKGHEFRDTQERGELIQCKCSVSQEGVTDVNLVDFEKKTSNRISDPIILAGCLIA